MAETNDLRRPAHSCASMLARGVLALGLSACDAVWAERHLGRATEGAAGFEVVENRSVAAPNRPAVSAAMPSIVPLATSGTRPELPRVWVDAAMPAVTGRTLRVRAGGDLQGALDAARPGDEVVIEAGATFTGTFRLQRNARGGDAWITVRSSGVLPPAGTRVTPASAPQMPKLVTPRATEPVLRTEAGAHHWRLVGLELTAKAGETLGYSLVQLGDGSSAQNTLDELPHHLVLDRVYLHGAPTLGLQRCLALNAGETAVIDSYLDDCHGRGVESQAIAGWNGSGPYKIVNNYLAGAGINVLFGGADPGIPNLVASDIEFRRNHVVKPMAWKGVWTVKNLLELKSARRVLIEGNVFENSWVDAQTGWAMVLWSVNPEGKCTGCGTADVTISHNVIRNTAGGFQLSAQADYPVVPMQRVTIAHNVATGVGAAGLGSNGRMYQLGGAIRDLVLSHNTTPGSPHGIVFASSPVLMAGFVVERNIFGGGDYQIFSSSGQGVRAWDLYAGPGSSITGNVIVGLSPALLPPGNSAPATLADVGFLNPAGGDYRLRSRSGAAGTGADADEVQSRVRDVVRGVRDPEVRGAPPVR